MTIWRNGFSPDWRNPTQYRCLVDLKNWTLLKWLDDPVPFFDWRASMSGDHAVHPVDRRQMAKMAGEFVPTGTASGVLRMMANGGGWTPVHVTVNRVQLEEDIYAGLATLRIPTDVEIAAAGLDDVDDADDAETHPNENEKPSPARINPLNPSCWCPTGPARAVARAGPTPIPPSATAASTVTTTSRSSTTHWVTAVPMARANADACEHAAPVPSARCPAAATAARSAAACARWRAITADPTYTPPTVIRQQHRHHRDGDQAGRAPLSANQVRPRRPPPLRW